MSSLLDMSIDMSKLGKPNFDALLTMRRLVWAPSFSRKAREKVASASAEVG